MTPFTEQDLEDIEQRLPAIHPALSYIDQNTQEQFVEWGREGVPAMATEIRRCWSRITELQEANNREVEKRRKAEYQHLHINPLLDRLKNEFWSLERARLDYEHEKERLGRKDGN